MRRFLLGLLIAAVGAGGGLQFLEPVETYTVELAPTSAEADAEPIRVECRSGVPSAELVDVELEQRARRECELEEDDADTTRLLGLGISSVVVLLGVVVALSGLRGWWRDARSRLEYRRMVRAHDRPERRRFRRGTRSGPE